MAVHVPFVDAPSPKPSLGFVDIARALAGRLLRASPPTMTTGIFGGYGSGKTTLMRAVQRELDKRRSLTPPVDSVWFDAWRYQHERHLFLPFLAALAADKRIARCRSSKNALGRAIRSFAYGFSFCGFSAKRAIDQEAHLKEQSRENIQKLTSGYISVHDCLKSITQDECGNVRRRIVVFIDDLDRCVAGKALALIEAIKAFLDTHGFLFVLGLDPRAVATYVRGKYGRQFGVEPKEYLEKVVQDPFTISPLALPEDRDDFFRMLRGRAGLACDREEGSAASLAFEALPHLPGNVRQIKRLLNTHQIIMCFSPTGDVNSEVLLHLLILQTRWPLAYWALQREQADPREELNAYLVDGEAKNLPDNLRGRDDVRRQLDDKDLRLMYDNCLRVRKWDVIRTHMSQMGRYVDVDAAIARQDDRES